MKRYKIQIPVLFCEMIHREFLNVICFVLTGEVLTNRSSFPKIKFLKKNENPGGRGMDERREGEMDEEREGD